MATVPYNMGQPTRARVVIGKVNICAGKIDSLPVMSSFVAYAKTAVNSASPANNGRDMANLNGRKARSAGSMWHSADTMAK